MPCKRGSPFGFELRLTSDASSTITLCIDKTPLAELHSIEDVARIVCADSDNAGEEVEMPWGIGCFDGPMPFPSDDLFVEFEPGGVGERVFRLERFGRRTANGGELESLETGREYRVGVSEVVLEVFWRWKWGPKREVLADGQGEKEQRWKRNDGEILSVVGEGFVFSAV